MTKNEAIKLLGGTPRKAQLAMGYTSIQAIYQWPDILNPGRVDRVNGALSRIKSERPTRRTRKDV